MKYTVHINVSIGPAPDDKSFAFSNSQLSYYKTFTITGETFSDLAPRIDAVMAAAASAAGVMEAPGHEHD